MIYQISKAKKTTRCRLSSADIKGFLPSPSFPAFRVFFYPILKIQNGQNDVLIVLKSFFFFFFRGTVHINEHVHVKTLVNSQH